MKIVVTITPSTPITISHHVRRPIARPKPRTGKPTPARIHHARPITAKPAQPTNAPRPCAVISAYQKLSPTRACGTAWLHRSTTPSRPEAARITVEPTTYRIVRRRAIAERVGVVHAGLTAKVEVMR